MSDITDDTLSGEIALIAESAAPTLSMTLDSAEGATVSVTISVDPGEGGVWKGLNPGITWDDGTGEKSVRTGTYTHTYTKPGRYRIGLTGYISSGAHAEAPGIEVTVAAIALGKGTIVETDIPPSVEQGASYDIQAKTKNGGSGSGNFKMQLLINGAIKSTSAQFTLAAGATSTDKIPAATAPATGDTMSYEIRCIRVT